MKQVERISTHDAQNFLNPPEGREFLHLIALSVQSVSYLVTSQRRPDVRMDLDLRDLSGNESIPTPLHILLHPDAACELEKDLHRVARAAKKKEEDNLL